MVNVFSVLRARILVCCEAHVLLSHWPPTEGEFLVLGGVNAYM